MKIYLSRGFKCYIARAENGNLWGFVAIKSSHPYYKKSPSEINLNGLAWTSLAENLNRVRIPDKPSEKIGRKGDWIFGFDSEKTEEEVRLALQYITKVLSRACSKSPPNFMVEDFKDSIMPELVKTGMDTTAARFEAWDAFVEVCVSNKVITKERADAMYEPEGLYDWKAVEFLDR